MLALKPVISSMPLAGVNVYSTMSALPPKVILKGEEGGPLMVGLEPLRPPVLLENALLAPRLTVAVCVCALRSSVVPVVASVYRSCRQTGSAVQVDAEGGVEVFQSEVLS